MPSSDSQEIKNGPHISFDDFGILFERVKRWDEFTDADQERGALNYITPEVVLSATSLIHEGIVLPMALPWNMVSGPDNPHPALHFMTDMGDVESPEPTGIKDFIGVNFHGKSISHLDALTHIAFKGQLFGGKSAAIEIDSTGSGWGSVDKLGPIVTRGVLLDAALMANQRWIEPGTAIHRSDVLALEERFGFKLGAGDCVLLHSGHLARRTSIGVWDPTDFSAGFHFDVIDLFKERKVSVIGADGDSDVRPSPVEGVHSPIHALALSALGIPLLDNLQLETLASLCTKLNRWTFTVVISPLNVPRGTGSPVTPVAIF
jgi:kynurenine formamidase